MKNLFFPFLFCLMLFPCSMRAQEKAAVKPSEKLRQALLVIDIQNAYLPHMSEQDKTTALEVIKKVVMTFHRCKLPVIRIYHQDLEEGPSENSEEFKFPASVEVSESDPKVIKHYPSAFTKTDLDKMLKEMNVDTVYLCGLSATACVLATYWGAIDKQYEAFMVKGGLISSDPKRTAFIESICKSVSNSTMLYFLKLKD
ncbi:MAG: isochorismatase family cysteine hydrolase [Bacteroidota bacterium]